jgi:hypothetical protein
LNGDVDRRLNDMGWQRLVGWQLVVFGGLWLAAVARWGDASAAALTAVPGVVETVLRDVALAPAWHAAPFVPGALAVALGVYCIWAARHPRRSLAAEVAAMDGQPR